MGRATDSDLALLHRFQKGCLNLGRRTVNFIGQNDVGKDWVRIETERAAIVGLGVNLGAVTSDGKRSGVN